MCCSFLSSGTLEMIKVHLQNFCSPDAILLSRAAGPSLSTFFTCRNSSVRSPPMMVKPNPWVLFFSAVWYSSPFSWLGSAVKPKVPPLPVHKGVQLYLWAWLWQLLICETGGAHFFSILLLYSYRISQYSQPTVWTLWDPRPKYWYSLSCMSIRFTRLHFQLKK